MPKCEVFLALNFSVVVSLHIHFFFLLQFISSPPVTCWRQQTDALYLDFTLFYHRQPMWATASLSGVLGVGPVIVRVRQQCKHPVSTGFYFNVGPPWGNIISHIIGRQVSNLNFNACPHCDKEFNQSGNRDKHVRCKQSWVNSFWRVRKKHRLHETLYFFNCDL